MLSLDEGLLGSWTGPFGWLVIAEPLTAAELRALSEEVGLRQRVAEAAADRFPERAAQAQRLKERHAELQRGGSAGFWRITVLAGGPDEPSAARDRRAAVRVGGPGRAAVRAEPGARGPAAPRASSRAGTPCRPRRSTVDRAARRARPAAGGEVPGVRLALRPEFDVTPEAPDRRRAAGIELGEVLDRNLMPGGPFVLPRGSLNRHVFVCGATGAGKSQTVRWLLESATGQRHPVAGGRAGQGRVPADGAPPARARR